jgi:hypothetical protein
LEAEPVVEGVHDYLPTNRRRAARLRGQQLVAAVRLMYEPPDDDELARLAWGPVLLTAADGDEWLLDVEESKANLLLLAGLDSAGPWYNDRPLRIPVATSATGDLLRFLLTEPIDSVEVVSRQPEPGVPDSFAMCGVRLTTASGAMVCIGTHLTEYPHPEVAFRLPDEVDSALRYAPL